MTNTNLQASSLGRQRLRDRHHFNSANHNAGSVLDVAEGDEVLDDLVLFEHDELLDMRDLLLDDAD